MFNYERVDHCILHGGDKNDVSATLECDECSRSFTISEEGKKVNATRGNTVTFSFDRPIERLEYSRPVILTTPRGTFSVKHWSDVHKLCLSYAFENNLNKLKEILDVEPPFRKSILFSLHRDKLRNAVYLGDGIYAEINFSSHGIMRIDSGLMAYCDFPINEFSVTCQMRDSHQVELDTALTVVGEPKIKKASEGLTVRQETVDISLFIAVLLAEFPEGFEFNDSSVRLLENAAGKACSEAERKELKRVMFKRHDGVFLLQEMVAKPETLSELKVRIEEYFSHYHAFSLSVLYDEFADHLRALANPDSDFRLFLLNAILPELPEGGKIFGRLQKQICIPGSSSQWDVLEFLAEQFREKLRENGDAVLMDELLSELPCLNFAVAEGILQEQLPNAVEIRMDGLQYWKLLEYFCLPEDFCEILAQVIGGIEQQNRIPSLQAVAAGLEILYGNDFREIYALDDDEVFRQVILKSLRNGDYAWKNNLLVKCNERRETNVADEFLQTRHGIFEEKEFFDYADQHRGLTDKGMLILSFLRCKCVRLDQSNWIGLTDFEKQTDFTEETAARMVQLLKSRLAHQMFLSLGTLPNAYYSELPPIHIQGQLFYWNEFLLASIAEHKLHALQVVNTDRSPYTVTAVVLPDVNDYDGSDVVGFVFRALQRASIRFDSADQVFEYLKEHKIRMNKTKKLMDRINSLWGLA